MVRVQWLLIICGQMVITSNYSLWLSFARFGYRFLHLWWRVTVVLWQGWILLFKIDHATAEHDNFGTAPCYVCTCEDSVLAEYCDCMEGGVVFLRRMSWPNVSAVLHRSSPELDSVKHSSSTPFVLSAVICTWVSGNEQAEGYESPWLPCGCIGIFGCGITSRPLPTERDLYLSKDAPLGGSSCSFSEMLGRSLPLALAANCIWK